MSKKREHLVSDLGKLPSRSLLVDFALTGAAYSGSHSATFSCFMVACQSELELTGVRKQTITLVQSSEKGCMANLAFPKR